MRPSLIARLKHRFNREVEAAVLRWRLRDLGYVGEGVAVWGPVIFLGRDNIRIGSRVSISGYLHVWGHGGVEIGDDVLIASHVAISSLTHDPHASPFNSVNIARPVRIKDNVWIGSHAFIGSGVTVESGSVVAAGAMVLHDVPRGVVVAGVPARVAKQLKVD